MTPKDQRATRSPEHPRPIGVVAHRGGEGLVDMCQKIDFGDTRE